MGPRCLQAVMLLWVFGAGSAIAQPDFVSNESLASLELRKFWQLQLPLLTGQSVADAFLVDDQLYLTTPDGYAYAVHAPTGTLRWSKQVTTAGYRLKQPAHGGDLTIFATPSQILQFDRLYGTRTRAIDLRFPAGSAPTVSESRIYLAGIDRRVYAFELSESFSFWKGLTGGPNESKPLVVGDRVYFASTDGFVYCLRTADHSLIWRSRPRMGSITADLAVDAEGVYAASRDRSLYQLELGTGVARWRARTSASLYEPPHVATGRVYQYNEVDGLIALDTAVLGVEERTKWTLTAGRRVLSQVGDDLLVQARDQRLLRVNAESGEIQAAAGVPGFTLGVSATGDAVAYLVSTDGRVFCARPTDVPFAKADEVRHAFYSDKPKAVAAATDAKPVEAPKTPSVSDVLTSKLGRAPIGGKSKISREFGGTGTPAPTPAPSSQPAADDTPEATDEPAEPAKEDGETP